MREKSEFLRTSPGSRQSVHGPNEKTLFGKFRPNVPEGNLTERGDSATITSTKITINRTGTYRHYSWDLLNRLENVEELDEHGNLVVIKEYGYDVNNLRIWEKNRHGQITHYVFDQKGNRIERHTEERSEYYIFRNLRHIAKRVVDHSTNTEKTYFYGTDHLGSTVLMTDEDGNEVFSAETTPFGDSVSELGPMADTEHLMYTGKDLDEDTGLYYFNARWYDPGTGRFISEDPARFGSNWYRYAASNPLKYFDPTGLNEVSWGTTIFDAGDYHTDTPENEKYGNLDETTTEVATYEEIAEQINHVSTGISAQETIAQQTEKLAELLQQDTSSMTLDEFLAYQQELEDLAMELLQGIQDYEAAGYELQDLAESNPNGNIRLDPSVTKSADPFETWWDKSDGELLTEAEAKIQKWFGISEMGLGGIGVFTTAYTAPALYIMADGAHLLNEALNGYKATPGLLAVDFMIPYIMLSDYPYTSPF